MRSCWYCPAAGYKFHLVLVDEADQMSRAAQLAFLSKLDSTVAPPDTIFVFTANDTSLLEKRFTSRCRMLNFTGSGLQEPACDLLARIWRQEKGIDPPADLHFPAIMEAAYNNVREALMLLEMELLSPSGRFTIASKSQNQSEVRLAVEKTVSVSPRRGH